MLLFVCLFYLNGVATKAEKQWKAAVLWLRERTTWAACGRRGDTAHESKPGRVLRSRRKTAGNTVCGISSEV